MSTSIIVIFFTICFALNCVNSNPTEEQASFIEGLNIQYENGTWICGEENCLSKATGCTIRLKSEELQLYRSFECIGSFTIMDTIDLDKKQLVYIEITSYAGAKPFFNIEYNDKNDEIADGFVPVEKLQELKEKFKELKRLVNEENKPVAVFTQGPYPGKFNHSKYLMKEEQKSLQSEVSYVAGLNFHYRNGTWSCGYVDCPSETTGCGIRFKSDEKNKKVFYHTVNCFGSISTGNRIELDKEKVINIDIRSFVGAKSDYTISYSADDEEVATGIVAMEDLEEFIKKFKEQKQHVVDGKSPFATSSFLSV